MAEAPEDRLCRDFVVLSLFPGLDVLGMGFEAIGATVVQGPDVILGRDIRTWDATALRGRIDGVIGGDPCQDHSQLTRMIRSRGHDSQFGDLSGEFCRIVEEVAPVWFLRENVPGAPDIKPLGYEVASFLLKNTWLGEAQRRKRRFWFGWPQEHGPAPNLMRWIPGVALEHPDQTLTVLAGHGPAMGQRTRGILGRSVVEMLELQGLPPDLLDHSPLTMQGKRKLVGNAVPLPMAKAIARAVVKALECPG